MYAQGAGIGPYAVQVRSPRTLHAEVQPGRVAEGNVRVRAQALEVLWGASLELQGTGHCERPTMAQYRTGMYRSETAGELRKLFEVQSAAGAYRGG